MLLNTMIKKLFPVIFIIIICPLILNAQRQYGRKYSPLYEFDGRYKLSGWHFAPGLTYTLTRLKNKSETLYTNNDTSYQALFDPSGRLGFYFELGRYRIFKYGYLFNYMDYSIAFKQIKGKEKFEGIWMQESNALTFAQTSGSGVFSFNYLTANFNLYNVKQLKEYTFLQTGIGINIDYSIIHRSNYDGNTLFHNQQMPSRFMSQIHFKLGFGWKASDILYIIPTLETPVLNLYEWYQGKSTLPVFSSRYRPLIFTLRIAWLSKPKPGDCPKVEGMPDDKKRQNNYQMNK